MSSNAADRTPPRPGFWTGDRVAGIALIVAAAALAFETRVLPLGSLGRPGPGYAPLLYAVILGVLGAGIAARRGGTPLGAIRWGEARHALMILLACGFAALAIERLGFRLTMLALVAFLLGVVERRPALSTALVSLGLSFGCYFVFWTLLRVPLPTGPFGL